MTANYVYMGRGLVFPQFDAGFGSGFLAHHCERAFTEPAQEN